MPALPELKEEIRTQIKGIIILALAVFCYAGLQFTGQTGEIGLFVNNVLRTLAGETALVIPFLMGVYGLKIMLPQRIINIRSRLTGVLILLLLLTISAHLNMLLNNIDLPAEENFFVLSFKLGLQHQGGGLIGATFASVLYFFFQEIGSLIVIITLASVSVLLITDVSITQFLKYLRKALSLLLVLLKKALLFIKDTYELIGEGEDALQSEGKKKKAESPLIAEEPTEDTLLTESKADKQQYQMERKAPVVIANRESSSYNIESEEVSEEGSSPGEVTKKSSSDYHKPPLLLLTKLKRLGGNQNQNGYMKERIKTLENTLKSFGVKAKVVNVLSGPTVTRFEVQPESGVKVSKISSLSDDLALNLAASDIRIEAPIPGKAAVGIEVPNKVLSPVYLRDVLEDDSFQESPSPLAIGLGQDITGVPVITDLLRMPHLLIAGATGSGKSVCLNCIITSILFKATPQEVKFLMIDPKFVELSIYNGIPHLLAPVVTKPKQAASALKNMVKEMSRRYESFAREGVRDITSYNKLATRSNGEVEPLPYIVIIIDELADLMMISPAEVEDSIVRLSQMSRAAGIYLVIATQRPSVDVITGLIKANITSRIAFTVSSQADSRTILDTGGAEKLLGRGDMLFSPVDAVKPFRIQGAYIGEKDLQKVVDYVKKQGEPEYIEDIIPAEADDKQEEKAEIDELFPEAVELVVRVGQASISLLQRRFRIGYTRAARLIDDLEKHGIVSGYEGSKPRAVLINAEQAAKFIGGAVQNLKSSQAKEV